MKFSLGMMTPEDMLLLFMARYAAMAGEKLPESLFEGDREAGAEAIFGLGEEDGRLVTRMALPAAGVNAVLRMNEQLEEAE